jgi:hypothetical protein
VSNREGAKAAKGTATAPSAPKGAARSGGPVEALVAEAKRVKCRTVGARGALAYLALWRLNFAAFASSRFESGRAYRSGS